MNDWLGDLVRGRSLELAVAVAVGYALSALVEELAKVPVLTLAQHVGIDPTGEDGSVLGLQYLNSAGVFRLSFSIGHTVIFYGDVLKGAIALALVLLVTVVVVRRRDRVLGVCPFCASRIPYEAEHCAYCGSGVTPAEP